MRVCQLRCRGMIAWAILLAATPTLASFREDFEGQQVAWRVEGDTRSIRVEAHERAPKASRRNDGCEHIRLIPPRNASVRLSYSVPRSAIIAETAPSVWIRVAPAGVRLVAKIELPRTLDPETGAPAVVLVAGAPCAVANHWQRLELRNLVTSLEREARVLRARWSRDVDTREACLTHLLLELPATGAPIELWIDELEVAATVERALVAAAQFQEEIVSSPSVESRAAISNSTLTLGARPVFPRIIEHQGEPLAWLRERGFNTVSLAVPPSDALLSEARTAEMWLISPPPAPVFEGDAVAPIDSRYDRVLAWNIGDRLAGPDLDKTRVQADAIRRADHPRPRPILGQPDSALRGYSRRLDVLVSDRDPVGSTCEMNDYGAWLRARSLLATPGTPQWVRFATQYSPLVRAQWNATGAPVDAAHDYEQIALVAHTAISAGARGLWYHSDDRLDGDAPDAFARASRIELVNRRLEIIEPLLAAGSYQGTINSLTPDVKAALLQSDRAKLMVPLWSGRGAQFAPGQSAGNVVTFVVPGVPESHEAFEITPSGLKPLRRKRVTGGSQITIEEFNLATCIVFSQDQLVITALTGRARQNAARISSLMRDVAADKLQRAMLVDGELAPYRPMRDAQEKLSAAQSAMQAADQQTGSSDFSGSWSSAQRAMRSLRMLERAHWEAAMPGLSTPVASSWAVSFQTLPQHWAMGAQLAPMRPMPNRLFGGDMESPDAMKQWGWQHIQNPQAGVAASADWVTDKPHSGKRCLRLEAHAEQAGAAPTLVEAPPLWIITPTVRVQPGQWLRIHGWVRTAGPIKASVDGLMIADSITGESLAERVGEATTWREFTRFRLAPTDGAVSLTFAMTGLGAAFLDDVTIEPLVGGEMPVPTRPSFPAPSPDSAARRATPNRR